MLPFKLFNNSAADHPLTPKKTIITQNKTYRTVVRPKNIQLKRPNNNQKNLSCQEPTWDY